MFRNYLIIAVRNLLRYKLFSAINIFGLSVGMACCILIFLYVQNECSYDRYNQKGHQIYGSSLFQVGSILNAFSTLTILIASLGLFGLAVFTSAQRSKEIGIRKVLGASVSHIALLLSKDFAGLVVIAAALACPIAYYWINRWLQSFAYHVNIGSDIFYVGRRSGACYCTCGSRISGD